MGIDCLLLCFLCFDLYLSIFDYGDGDDEDDDKPSIDIQFKEDKAEWREGRGGGVAAKKKPNHK